MITSENYFELHQILDVPVLSHSLLKSAMPMNGGDSHRIEMAYEKLLEKKDSPAKKLGSLLHSYVEDPDQFVWQPEWEMSEKLQLIAEKLFRYAETQGPVKETPMTYIEMFNTICEEEKYGQRWTEETRYTKFRDACMPFWLFMIESKDKVAVHGGTLEAMKGMIASIEDSEIEVPVLRDREGTETHRELCVLWSLGNFTCKSMLDIVEVNRVVNTIDVWDLKTTGFPIGQFSFKYSYAIVGDRIQSVPLISSYVKYNYFTQEYLYRLAAKQWAEENGMPDAKINFHFAAIESAKPHLCEWIKPVDEWMEPAEQEINAALDACDHWFRRKKYNQF